MMSPRTLESGGADQTRPREPREGSASERTTTATSSVLVVEDNASVSRSMLALLEALGYRAKAVPSSMEALEAYARAQDAGVPFDVVLLDQTLAGPLGGEDTLHLLRELNPEIRAILLSGHECEQGGARIRRMGFQCCLQKPVSMANLRDAIEAACH